MLAANTLTHHKHGERSADDRDRVGLGASAGVMETTKSSVVVARQPGPHDSCQGEQQRCARRRASDHWRADCQSPAGNFNGSPSRQRVGLGELGARARARRPHGFHLISTAELALPDTHPRTAI